MSGETYRELGKLMLDFSKISGGLGVLLTFLRSEKLSSLSLVIALALTLLFILVGVLLIEEASHE